MPTRKDFQAVARILHNNHNGTDVVISIANDFAVFFASQNPRFDRDKFLNAVSTGEGLGR